MSSRVVEKAHRMAMEGTPKQAKYATRVIAYSKSADASCSDLVDVSLPPQEARASADEPAGPCIELGCDQQESRLAPFCVERVCALMSGGFREQRREDNGVHSEENHQCGIAVHRGEPLRRLTVPRKRHVTNSM